MIFTHFFFRFVCIGALLLGAASIVQAQTQPWPNRPIRLVVPFSPGGAVDVLARPLAQKLSEALGQPVVVESRPGSNGSIGFNSVAKAQPDGYTLLIGTMNNYILNLFTKDVPYDPFKELVAITDIAYAPAMVVVHPSLPVNSRSELIDYGKKNPGKLFYGTIGVGSNQHLGGVLLSQLTGVELTHVAYKGGSSALVDVLAGQIPVAIVTASTVLPHVRSGKLRGLGLLEAKRLQSDPSIPTVRETIPAFNMPDLWFGVMAPAGLPRPVVDRLNTEVRRIANSPEYKAQMEGLGFTITNGRTPQDFLNTIKADNDVFRKIVTAAKIQPE